jgi:hypothetical protein
MYLDWRLALGVGWTPPGAGVATKLTNIIDLTQDREIGGGEPVRIMFKVTESFDVAAGSPTFEFRAIIADVVTLDGATAIQLCRTAEWGATAHLAGILPQSGGIFELVVPQIPAAPSAAVATWQRRYFGLQFANLDAVPATNYFDAGILEIYIVKDVDSMGRIYPAGTST